MERFLILTLFSLLCIGIFFSLFVYETNRGLRFGEPIRARFDHIIRVYIGYIQTLLSIFQRTVIRQCIHYLMHTFLRVMLSILRTGEKYLENTIRMNRGVAKRIVRDGENSNKLGKVIDHKREIALSDEEKKVERAKSLEGR